MLWSLLLLPTALAYESDTLTDRDQPLTDVAQTLDERVQEVVLESIAWTNTRTGCKEPPEQMHRMLAKAINARMSPDELVTQRRGFASFGFDRYAAWIEKGGVVHRDFADRRDIYGDLTFSESPILKLAGVCSTVRVGHVLLGTDKFDHFFEEGYDGWRHSDYGARPQRAIEWATHTELTTLGLETSLTFSYADLRADYDGMEFFDTLLDPEHGVARVGADGCLQPTHPFEWENWVTWQYDEVLNPNVYTPTARDGVTRHLWQHRDEYCASYRKWDGPDYKTHLHQALSGRPFYAALDAPERTDPLQLDALCAGWVPNAPTAADLPAWHRQILARGTSHRSVGSAATRKGGRWTSTATPAAPAAPTPPSGPR